MSTDRQPSETPIDAASLWLARRDRGLTAPEQDAYLQWLRENPAHGQAIARLEKTWTELDILADWRPAHSTPPNPDLLAVPPPAPARARPGRVVPFRFVAPALAAAAAVVAGVFLLRPPGPISAPAGAVNPHGVNAIPLSERLTLEDGSVVELNRGGKIEPTFTPGERRVRLVHGEAHFTVTKNPARPFVVEAGTVAVRAVGTAFDVRRAAASVEVLVTEGKVRVERPALASPTPLEKGERAVVDTRSGTAQPVVTRVTPADIERTLDWEGVRLEFTELPLSEVVTEFNLRNRQQLAIGDAMAGRLRVTGSNFRADNVEGFVRLLEQSFGVTADRRADGTIVLRGGK